MQLNRIVLGMFALGATFTANAWQQESGSTRTNAVKQSLVQFNQGISSTDRTAKYQKMAASPFIFYRGTAHLYYQDLAAQSEIANNPYAINTAKTWIQGDMHVQNYGAFHDDENTIVYDLNDFDEAWIASYLYDVYRNAASIALAADELGFSASQQRDAIESFSEAYLDTIEDYRSNNAEKSFKMQEANAYGRLDNFLEDAEDNNSRSKELNKWTVDQGAQRSFQTNNPDLAAVNSSTYQAIENAIESYHYGISSNLAGNSSYFRVLDIAQRLNQGTGSLGTTRYYVLIEGPSSSDNDDILLDVKQQGLPSIYNTLSTSDRSAVLNHFASNQQGCRVVNAQKAMLTDVDDHLGCVTLSGNSYSVRERSPWKESFDLTELSSTKRLRKLAEQWGIILATDHARADVDYNSSQVSVNFDTTLANAIDGNHSDFNNRVADFGMAYAEQVNRDYQSFLSLLQSGQL